MTIEEYRHLRDEHQYEERLRYVTGTEPTLQQFLRDADLDLDLKIYLAKVIILRHFGSTGGVLLPADIDWFINSFLKGYTADHVKPWISGAIRESIGMIMSGETFTKLIVGMNFMFGVIEFHTKYRLGWRPENFDHFDNEYHDPFRKMALGPAITRLKKTNTRLAQDLSEIDNASVTSLREAGIEERRFVKARIADRLMLARNSMIHGEAHYFYDKAKYLVLLYILFYFHDTRDGFRYEGK